MTSNEQLPSILSGIQEVSDEYLKELYSIDVNSIEPEEHPFSIEEELCDYWLKRTNLKDIDLSNKTHCMIYQLLPTNKTENLSYWDVMAARENIYENDLRAFFDYLDAKEVDYFNIKVRTVSFVELIFMSKDYENDPLLLRMMFDDSRFISSKCYEFDKEKFLKIYLEGQGLKHKKELLIQPEYREAFLKETFNEDQLNSFDHKKIIDEIIK